MPVGATQRCFQVGSQRKNIREPEGVSSQTSSWLTPGANVTHRDWDQCSGSLAGPVGVEWLFCFSFLWLL